MDFVLKFAASSMELKRLIPYVTICGAFFIVFSCFYVIPNVRQEYQIYVVNSFLNQRNELSYLLNREKQKTGQLECKNWARSTSSSGGWCKKDSRPSSSQHKTDLQLAKQLSIYLKGKRVGSFGDGPGLYKKYFDETKQKVREEVSTFHCDDLLSFRMSSASHCYALPSLPDIN